MGKIIIDDTNKLQAPCKYCKNYDKANHDCLYNYTRLYPADEACVYDKETRELIQELLEDDTLYINKSELVERLVKIDMEYDQTHWNLLQILTNVNMIIERH